MSRILKVLIVLLAITAMVAPTVFADDRLSLSGEFRVRGFYMDEFDFDNSTDTTNVFNDQRFRIAGTLNVAEGVAIKFRTDVTESTWGSNGKNTTRFANEQWDKAYIELKKGIFTVTAGQQYTSLGRGLVVDHIGAGINVMIDAGGIPVKAIWTKIDEGASINNNDGHDTDIYGLQVGHKTDMYAANVFFATEQFGNTFGQEAYVVGTDFAFNFDAIKLIGELDYFTGEMNSNQDYFGTQLYLDGSMALSETATVGVMGLFALGSDDTAGTGNEEVQLTRLPGSVFGDWMPEYYGPFATDFDGLDGTDIMDFTGESAGIIAGSIYSTLVMSDDLTLTLAGMYGVPQEDANTDVDSFYTLNAGAIYKLLPNTELRGQLVTAMADGDDTKDDQTFGAMWGLYVKF